MSDMQTAARAWHKEWAKAFITSVSADGEYYIKAKFKTMAEMYTAYDAMANLAAISLPTPQDSEAVKP